MGFLGPKGEGGGYGVLGRREFKGVLWGRCGFGVLGKKEDLKEVFASRGFLIRGFEIFNQREKRAIRGRNNKGF